MQPHETQKVTVDLPVKLLKEAQALTGKGLSETLKIALEQLAHTHACDNLSKLRGKVDFTIDFDKLREDKS